jgi:hypothetical protein
LSYKASFAKNELNFDVPYTALIKGGKEFHYIVKRYDRFDNYKYHQKDFAQYLAMASDKKYNSTSEELFIKINEVLYNKEEKLKALNIGRDKYILTLPKGKTVIKSLFKVKFKNKFLNFYCPALTHRT